MPLAKDERLARGDDHGQRGDGAPVAERLGERSGVVLAADGPAEPEPRRGEPGKRALEVRVEAPAEALDRGGVERLARGDQALTLALSPGAELVGGHGLRRAGAAPNGPRRGAPWRPSRPSCPALP